MKTVYDIQQYLKRFGSYIYLGDRLADLQMMEFEVRELYNFQLIDIKEYQSAILIFKHEIALEREKQKKG